MIKKSVLCPITETDAEHVKCYSKKVNPSGQKYTFLKCMLSATLTNTLWNSLRYEKGFLLSCPSPEYHEIFPTEVSKHPLLLFCVCIDACMLSRFSQVWLFIALGTLSLGAHQAPPSIGFSRQEYWSGSHSLLQVILLTQGSNPWCVSYVSWWAGSLPLMPPC